LHVRVFPPAEVTSTHEAVEVAPGEAGLTPADVETIWASVVRLYETGLHPAIALCLRRRGKIVLNRAIGHLRGNAPGERRSSVPLVPARHDSLFNLFSASKAVTAMVVHLLDERRLVHLDDPVAEYVPELGRNGKEAMTLRQLLTHRAGIPAVSSAAVDPGMVGDWDRVLATLYEARPLSVPGRQLAYHALTSGFVFGEVVRRVTGRDIRQYLHDEVLSKLGFSTFNYGVPAARVAEVAQNAFTGLPAVPPLAWFLRRSIGLSAREATELSNDPRFLTAIVPSGNVIGTAEEASRFFQLLLDEGELEGQRVFDRRTVRRAVAEQSHLEIDSFLGLPVREHAFGHIGFTTVVAWADPDRDLAVALLTSGKPVITPGQVRWLQIARAISRCCPRGEGAPRRARVP
jgi:CubicO group peptidase (beta-lactamase class C family)